MSRPLEIALAVSATVAVIATAVPELHTVGMVARPLATFCATMLASSLRDSVSANYRLLVLAGMTIALTGDFLNVVPGDQFKAELFSNAGAQLAFFLAFVEQGGLAERKIPYLGYALVISPLLASIVPTAYPSFKLAITLSIVATAVAAAQSASWMLSSNSRPARLAGAGSAWLVVSNATLIINRFRVDIPFHEVIVLGTYWIGLWCIARSVSRIDAAPA